ncbi:MAG: diguanylate cyclase [Alphaproteobacteria bacterium]|nr:diguanylate cyclase [Alphaproteobacteria bacterium]
MNAAIARGVKAPRYGAAASIIIPAVVLAVGLALAFFTARFLADDAAQEAHERLDRLANRVRTTIEQRLVFPLYGLRGLNAAFAARGDLTRAEFRAVIAARDLPREFPGVRGFGYAEHVTWAEAADFVAATRRDGAPEFELRTKLGADEMFIVKYAEPAETNNGVIGFDEASDPVRRAAIDAAVETGAPSLSGTVTLLQDGGDRKGLLLIMPLYDGGIVPVPAARRAAVRGFVYAPMILDELLGDVAGITDDLVEFDLYDGLPDGALLPFYSYRTTDSSVPVAAMPKIDGSVYFLPTVVAGRLIVMRAWGSPRWTAGLDRTLPPLVFGGIAAISLALAFVLWVLATGRARAMALAHGMTAELDRLAKVVERTTNGVVIAGPDRRIVWVNDGFTRLTGYSFEEALGRKPRELVQFEGTSTDLDEEMRACLAERRPFRGEIRNRAKDGRLYWVDLEIRPTTDAAGAFSGFMAIQSDITQRKEAFERLAESEAELRRALSDVEEERSRVEQQAMELAALAEQLSGEKQKSVEALELLREAIESMEDAFCLFDPDGRVVMFNAKYLDPYGRMADLIAPGVSFEFILRLGIEIGLYPEAESRIDEYVRDRVGRFGENSPAREAHSPDGRWYRITRLRTPSGHTITSRVDITELKEKEAALAKLNVELERLATTDPLTGVANRRSFVARGYDELARVHRDYEKCTLLALDIDHFKRVNDTYGHAAGDRVLVEFAHRVSACLRQTDILGRLGGEEFSILAPGITAGEAQNLAERVRVAVRASPITVDGTPIDVTVSIGISQMRASDSDVSSVQRRADDALYQAKHQGRDRFVLAEAAE